MEAFRFQCSSCGEMHEGLPSFVLEAPREYLALPEDERVERAEIDSDICVIDEKWFFIRVQLEIPIRDFQEPFVWGLWVSISLDSFKLFLKTYESTDRDKEPPFFAWLTSVPYPYSNALLKSRVHLRPFPTRPWLELEPTDHPLAIDQHQGITVEKAQSLVEQALHG